MTELGFLVSLLLDHKLPAKTKQSVAERIKEVEASMAPTSVVPAQRCTEQGAAETPRVDPKTAQSPSTQRILDEMAAESGLGPPPEVTPQGSPAQGVSTPAASQALAARAQLIRGAVSKKGPIADQETGRPRKW